MPTFSVAAFACGLITDALKKVIFGAAEARALQYLERKRLERKIDEVTETVVWPALSLLDAEQVDEERQRRLWQTCHDELARLLTDPAPLFRGSLDGQKVYAAMYVGGVLPQVIREDGLEDVYARIFPRAATLICKMPAAIMAWEADAWAENFGRMDALAEDVRGVSERVDMLLAAQGSEAASLLARARGHLLQDVALQLDVTSLRAEQPLKGKLDQFFVCPAIATTRRDQRVVAEDGAQYVDAFLRPCARTVIIGAPGSGKSTWTRWLQRHGLGEAWAGLPVRIDLRDLRGAPLPPIGDLVRGSVSRHLAEEVTAPRIREWLDAGSLAFLIDGFDELPVDARDRMSGPDRDSDVPGGTDRPELEELAAAAPMCPMVLTSRPLTTGHLIRLGQEGWETWTMEAFDAPRVSQYVTQWYANMPLSVEAQSEVNVDELAAEWLRDPAVGPLTGNPLLLATLVMVHHLDGRLPPGRSALYQRYVTGMLGVWDSRRGVSAASVPLPPETGRYLLSSVAIHMHLRDVDELEHDEAVALVQAALDRRGARCDASGALATLVERTGLIVGSGVHTFVHKSVGEFLVAEAVVQGDREDETGHRLDRLTLLDHCAEDRWNVITFLWAGLASIADVEEFAARCLSDGSPDLGFGLLADQYDRFAVGVRRSLLLRTFEQGSRMAGRGTSSQDGSYMLVMGGRSPAALRVPDSDLRALGGDLASLYALLYRSAADGLIRWSDVPAGSGGPVRDLWWMVIASVGRDDDDWGVCVASGLPDGWDTRQATQWLLQVALWRWLLGDDACEDRVEAVLAMCDAAPAWLDVMLIWTAAHASTARSGTDAPIIARSAQMLARLGGAPSDARVLAATIDGDPIFRGDAIAWFARRLDSMSEPERVAIGSSYSRAAELVQSLLLQREALRSAESVSAGSEAGPPRRATRRTSDGST